MNDRLQAAASGRTGPKPLGLGAWIAGRANRREYWVWVGPLMIAQALAGLVSLVLSVLLGWAMIAIWIRRLHDLGWTGWLAPAINFGVVLIGFLAMAAGPQVRTLAQGLVALGAIIALGALPGQPGSNEFGPPPGRKAANPADTFA